MLRIPSSSTGVDTGLIITCIRLFDCIKRPRRFQVVHQCTVMLMKVTLMLLSRGLSCACLPVAADAAAAAAGEADCLSSDISVLTDVGRTINQIDAKRGREI